MIKKITKFFLKFILFIFFIFFLLTFVFYIFSTKKKDAIWELGQEKIPEVVFSENGKIEIKDLRDFDWNNIGNETSWKDLKFKKSQIVGMEVGISHFHVNEGIGHVFLIFNLDNGKDFALSIESRREKGEEFTFLGGLKFDYEISYFLATKKDLLSLRKKLNERVYVYPIKTSPKKSQEIFEILSKRVNSLKKDPEFYHIIFKNCTNSITREIEKISEKTFPILERSFLPGYADRALFEMGLIETKEKSFEETKKKFLVDFMENK